MIQIGDFTLGVGRGGVSIFGVKFTNENYKLKYTRKWNVNRPSPKACELILGLLRAVYNYHVDGESHGSLWNPDNYLIQYENCGEKVKQVLLVHDRLHDRGNEKATKENDIEDVSELIFKGILNVSQQNFPAELHHLYDLLKSAVDGSPNTWRPILKHPSLWNFSVRITFVDRVHMYMKNNQLFTLVDRSLNSCQDLHNWKSKVFTNTPMGTFLSKNPYKSTPIEFFRFTRNFLNHYMDKYFVIVGDFTLGVGRGGVSIFGVKFANENYKLKYTRLGKLESYLTKFFVQ
ncbi:hypothetical protein SO802_005772 [Lithocarpus litseifolius]|uniref:Homing endonuclease LAGLIDADG domain-containing protein n=1 Tax=Lithocarpus litseifolius TaxID=425828 RepID=A0AAW2DKG1_9ROSI